MPNFAPAAQALSIESPILRPISLRINAINGINLAQGICQLPVPQVVLNAAHRALDAGINRYTPSRGLSSLRNAVQAKLARDNGILANPETEILITCGSTGAFEGVCATLLNPGDEVISFSPYYPYHTNTLKRFGTVIKHVPLMGETGVFDDDELERAFSARTKFLLINTPNNPTGKVFTLEELQRIGRLCQKFDTLVVTDEIYEYMTFDSHSHISPASLPEFSGRTITIGGFSKTFAITGWRIGFAVVPEALSDFTARLLDSIYVCPPAPLQQGVADAIGELPQSFYSELREMYQLKRDNFLVALRNAGLRPRVSQGSYFVLADFSESYPELDSMKFVDLMIERTQVAAVPSADFVKNPTEEQWVRFCFGVPDEMLKQAGEQLSRLN